jgi:hypothetical protein
MVALHGGSDRPGWACGEWRAIADAYPFLVCPRGQGADAALYWSTPAKTKQAIERLVAVARGRFGAKNGDWLAEGPVVLAGFSMGATQAMLLGREEPKRWPRLAIAENAYDQSAVSAFAASYAGERVAFLCTTVACGPVYRAAGATLAKRGVPARVNLAGTNAHGMWTITNESMRRDWPWLEDGVQGWEAYASNRLPGADGGTGLAGPGTTIVFDPP